MAGLFLVPKSGDETGRVLKDSARKREEEVLDQAKERHAAFTETVKRRTPFIAEKTADAEASFRVGREAMKVDADKCCRWSCRCQRGAFGVTKPYLTPPSMTSIPLAVHTQR